MLITQFIKEIKKLNDYYTVEVMKKKHKNLKENIDNNVQKNNTSEMSNQNLKQALSKLGGNSNISNNTQFKTYLINIENVLKNKIFAVKKLDNHVYKIEISSLLNKFELNKIKNICNDLFLEIGFNYELKNTTIFLFKEK